MKNYCALCDQLYDDDVLYPVLIEEEEFEACPTCIAMNIDVCENCQKQFWVEDLIEGFCLDCYKKLGNQ